MKSLKPTYVDAVKKKAVRKYLIDLFKFNEVIGLAGPDINEYLTFFKKRRCKKFEVYEVDSSTMVKQLTSLRVDNIDLHLKYDDILQADPTRSNTLYDLDFCASVLYLKEHITRFKQNFIMTFSTRIGVQKTIDTFFNTKKETILSKEKVDVLFECTKFITDQGEYLFAQYRDTSPMCCIAKIK